MTEIRGPDSIRGQGGLAAALGAIIAPLLVLPLLAPGLRELQTLASASKVVACIGVLFAAALLYLNWRANGGPIGWLVLGLTAAAVQALAMSGVSAANPAATETHPGWLGLTQIMVGVGLSSLIFLSHRRSLRVDPLIVGVLAGIAVVTVRYLLITVTPSLNLPAPAISYLRLLVLAVGLTIAAELYLLTVAPRLGAHPPGCRVGSGEHRVRGDVSSADRRPPQCRDHRCEQSRCGHPAGPGYRAAADLAPGEPRGAPDRQHQARAGRGRRPRGRRPATRDPRHHRRTDLRRSADPPC